MIPHFDRLRTSDCSTTPFRSPTGGTSRGLDNGYIEGGVAIGLSDKTYVGIRQGLKGTDPTQPVVDFRMVAFDYETRQVRACTENLANTGATCSTVPDGHVVYQQDCGLNTAVLPPAGGGGAVLTAPFIEPLEVKEGEWIILAQATYGEFRTKNFVYVAEVCFKAVMGLHPQLAFQTYPTFIPQQPGGYPTGGFEGGVPSEIGDRVPGNYPWAELVEEL